MNTLIEGIPKTIHRHRHNGVATSGTLSVPWLLGKFSPAHCIPFVLDTFLSIAPVSKANGTRWIDTLSRCCEWDIRSPVSRVEQVEKEEQNRKVEEVEAVKSIVDFIVQARE